MYSSYSASMMISPVLPSTAANISLSVYDALLVSILPSRVIVVFPSFSMTVIVGLLFHRYII